MMGAAAALALLALLAACVAKCRGKRVGPAGQGAAAGGGGGGGQPAPSAPEAWEDWDEEGDGESAPMLHQQKSADAVREAKATALGPMASLLMDPQEAAPAPALRAPAAAKKSTLNDYPPLVQDNVDSLFSVRARTYTGQRVQDRVMLRGRWVMVLGDASQCCVRAQFSQPPLLLRN